MEKFADEVEQILDQRRKQVPVVNSSPASKTKKDKNKNVKIKESCSIFPKDAVHYHDRDTPDFFWENGQTKGRTQWKFSISHKCLFLNWAQA